MTLKGKTIRSGDQQIGINALVYCEELKGSLSEEVEQGRKLKFDGKVQVQDIPLTGKRGQTKLFKAENEKRRNTCAVANMNAENRVNIQHDPGVVQSNCQNLSGDEDWVIVNGEDQPNQSPSTTTTLEFQLTQSLLSQVRVNEDNRNANSGKQAQLDLIRMNFVINGKTIDKKCILELYDKNNHLIQNGNEDYRPFAKQVFTGMFEYVKAEIPNDHILEELITNCNQAGYEFTMYGQIQPILVQYNLAPTIPEKKISICCNSVDFASVEYSDVIVVKNPDLDQFEQYESSSKLEFTLKFQNGEVEYENGKVTLNIPEQLKNYKADGKSLLDNVKEYFTDADNAVVESLIANIVDGPKSFIIDLPTEVASSVDNSFDIIPENAVFDLGDMAKLVEEAVDNKDVNALNTYINVVQAGITHVSPREGLLIVEKVLEIVSQFVKEQGEAWSTYCAMPVVREVYAAKKYAEGYISQEDYGNVKELEKVLRRTKSILSNNENGKNNDQSSSQKNPKTKSTDSQQQQKNVVDKRKNIMDNRKASIQGSIGSNHEGGCMHGNDQDTKSIEARLSDAIFSLSYEKVKSLVEQLKQGNDNTEQIIREALKKANDTEVGKKDKESKSKIIQIRKFLAEELKSIDAKVAVSSVVGSVGGVSTATSDQPVNIDDEKKQVSDQPTAQMPLQVENGSEFEGKDDQRDSPSPKSSANGDERSSSSSSFVDVPTSGESDTNGSNSGYVEVSPLPGSDSGPSFENIESVPTSGRSSPQATTSDDSDKEASQPVEPEVSNPQAEENTAPLKTPEESESQELASVVQNTETENDILSIQPTAPESTDKEQAAEQTPLQVEGKSEFEGKRDSPSPESSASGGSSSSSFVNVSTSDGGVTDSSNGEYVKVEDIVEDTALKDIGSLQDIQAEASRPLSSASLSIGNMPTAEEPAVVTANIGDSQQLKTLPFDSEPSRMGVAGSTTALSVKSDKKKQTPVQPAKDIAQIDDDDDYDLSWLSLEEDEQSLHLVEPIPSLTSKKPEQVNNTTPQNTKSSNLHIIAASVLADEQSLHLVEPIPSLTSKKPEQVNNTTPQNTKSSNLHIIAASVLAIAGVALGVAIAVHLEMLVVGIAVGACCLVAATVMYYYKWPSSFIENNQIEKVAPDGEKEPVATSV